MVEGLLRELGSSVNAVHQLQGTGAVIVGVLPAVLEPVLEARGLVGKADAQQAVEREGRVTNPGIPIVPVALSTDRFRQTASGSRHDGAGWLEGQKLERQCGTLHDLAPATRISALGKPSPPEIDGGAKEVLRLPDTGTTCQRILGSQAAQDERDVFALAEREIGDHTSGNPTQRH